MRNRPANRIQISGRTLGRWLVLHETDSRDGHRYWLCRCDCGKEKVVAQQPLLNSHSRSCGCLHREEHIKRLVKHGLSKKPEYKSWHAMRRRCNNPRDKDFPRYGGSGIKVCRRWESFQYFFLDMGTRPSTAHSLDRIDGKKGYAPSNCRWATQLEQQCNKRSNRLLAHKGLSLTMSQWEKRLGIRKGHLSRRLDAGWPLAKALLPTQTRAKKPN